MNKHFRPTTLTAALMLMWLPGAARAQQLVPWMEAPIISWTNTARHHYGRSTVTPNARLTRAAQQHALNMAAQETMSHSLDGLNLVDRVNRVGYAYANVGENVAYNFGYQNPTWQLFDGWMKSEGHFRNIVNGEFTEIGVGAAYSASGRFYACQVFGRPASMAAPYAIPYSNYTGIYPTQPSQRQAGDFFWYFGQ